MNKIITVIAGICFLFSCKEKAGSKKYKLLLDFRCEAWSYLSFDKNTLTVIDNLRRDFLNEHDDYYQYVQYAYDKVKDSLVSIKYVNPLKPESFPDTLRRMHKAPLYIDSTDGYEFRYDSVPQELARKFPDVNNLLLHFNQLGKKWIYTTREYTKDLSGTYLNIADSGNRNIIKIPLPEEMSGPAHPDILFYDITGDGVPEVFLFQFGYMMNRYHFDCEVYRVDM